MTVIRTNISRNTSILRNTNKLVCEYGSRKEPYRDEGIARTANVSYIPWAYTHTQKYYRNQ